MIQFDQPILSKRAVQLFNHVEAPTSNGQITLMSGDYSLGRYPDSHSHRNTFWTWGLEITPVYPSWPVMNWGTRIPVATVQGYAELEFFLCREGVTLWYWEKFSADFAPLEVDCWRIHPRWFAKGPFFVLKHVSFFWIFDIPNLVTLRNFFTRWESKRSSFFFSALEMLSFWRWGKLTHLAWWIIVQPGKIDILNLNIT